ncbi:hypothetical protein ONZ45_g2159 [Pleurotus djamor]|nr:hypothetical protein ONZ45_g2159 [Pleurotus djamor]
MDKSPRLPLEIFAEIISWISDDLNDGLRQHYLRQCAGVSRAFLSLARYHQYRHTELLYDYFERDLAFFRFLAPHLGSYVQSLHLQVLISPRDQRPAHFAVGFEPFNTVRTLELQSGQRWAYLPRTLRIGLCRLVSTQTLTRLYLYGWAFKPGLQDLKHLLGECGDRLEELALISIGSTTWITGFGEDEDDEEDEDNGDEHDEDEVDELPEWAGIGDGPVCMPRLKTLQFQGVQNWVRKQNFLSCPALSYFDTQLAMYIGTPYIFPRFLHAVTSLQHLVIHANYTTTWDQLDVSLRPTILSLKLAPEIGVTPLYGALTWAARFLAALPCRSSLQHLNISVSHYWVSYPDCINPPGCDSLSSLLQILVTTGQLQKVELRCEAKNSPSRAHWKPISSASQKQIQKSLEHEFSLELETGLMTLVVGPEC